MLKYKQQYINSLYPNSKWRFKMLKFKYVLLTSFLLFLFVMTSCSSDSDEKTFEMEIVNASNSAYLLLFDFDTNFVYTGDNYGIGVEFIKEPKESVEEYY